MTAIQIRDRLGAALFVLLLACAPAAAQERGTAEQAQAMVAAAIASYDANGAGATFDRINDNPKPEFFDGDLYVFVIGTDGITAAHAANVNMVGMDAATLSDVDGKAFGAAMIAEATPEGTWVDYRWEDPSTGQIAAKSSWVVLHDGYIFGCGIYKTDGS